MKEHPKQLYFVEYLPQKNIAPTVINRVLLNIYGDEIMYVSTVRRCVMRFITVESDVPEKSGSPSLVQVFANAVVRRWRKHLSICGDFVGGEIVLSILVYSITCCIHENN